MFLIFVYIKKYKWLKVSLSEICYTKYIWIFKWHFKNDAMHYTETWMSVTFLVCVLRRTNTVWRMAATFQRRHQVLLRALFQSTSGQMSRTTDVPLASASWIAVRPWRDSNPQQWGARDSKAKTLTTRLRTPPNEHNTCVNNYMVRSANFTNKI